MRSAVDIERCVHTLMANAGKAEWVYITGGEPFLVECLPDICRKLRSSFKVGVTTNGTIFRPEIANCVNRMGISLDGDKKYHDIYRGQGVFDKAINLFYAIKDKCESVIMSVAFKDNFQALINLKQIVEKLNPTYWQIQRDVSDPSVEIPSILCEG
jgi:sulfatase maturation enzyme AslB (radical SAM superfamily)